MFFRGAEAAARILHVPPRTYVCPLCARGFGLDALHAGDLTLEHAPPRSAGGRGIVLTCRHCNSVAGHDVDAAVADRERAYAFVDAVNGIETGAATPARLRIGGEELNITFARDGEWGALNVLPAQNDPAAVDRLNAKLERFVSGDGAESLELGIRMRRGFHGGRALVGDLKAAYLLAFAVWGYTWAAHRSLVPVRTQIANPDAEILQQWWLDADRVPERVVALTDTHTEPSFRCVCVRLPRTVVLLPWFDRGDLYKRIAAAESAEDGPLRFGQALRLPWPQGPDLRLDFLDVRQRALLG